MFKTILVPTDGSELAFKAAQTAIDFARESGARLITLSVAESFPYIALAEGVVLPNPEEYDEALLEAARNSAQQVADAAAKAGVACEAISVQAVDPSTEIIDTANRRACDAIFIASHGRRGLGRIWLGSVTQRVLAGTSLPVLVIR